MTAARAVAGRRAGGRVVKVAVVDTRVLRRVVAAVTPVEEAGVAGGLRVEVADVEAVGSVSDADASVVYAVLGILRPAATAGRDG